MSLDQVQGVEVDLEMGQAQEVHWESELRLQGRGICNEGLGLGHTRNEELGVGHGGCHRKNLGSGI